MPVADVAAQYTYGRSLMMPPRAASPLHMGSSLKHMMDKATLPASSEVGSVIRLGLIKPEAVISALGYIQWAALGTNVTLDLGVADDAELGISAKGDILIDGVAAASAGSTGIIASVSLANRFKPLWELAGLTALPTKQLQLIATVGGATSSAGGLVAWEIPFTSY